MNIPIKHKRGTTVPTANDLVVGEIAINTATGVCYTKTGAGNIVSIGAVNSDYLTKSGNLDGLTDLSVARANLNLGIYNTAQFGGVDAVGAGSNIAHLTPTALSLTHTTNGTITISPSGGITFTDGSTQATAATTFNPTGYATESFVTSRGYITSAALYGYATESWVTSHGYLVNGDNGTVPAGGDTGQVLTKASGSNYSFIWSTPIVYDRYLTSSTTSNTVGNGTMTFTIGTGLSYTPQQDITISANDGSTSHMHGLVTSYNSTTGVLVVDVQNHTGNGTHSAWIVNVGGTVPLQSLEWGGLTGTLSNQTDLQTALDGKYSTSNPAGYVTSSAIANVVYNTEPRIIALNTSFIPQQGYSTVTFNLTYYDGWVGADVTTPITINSPIGYYDGWTVTLDNNYSVGNVITNTGAKTVLIGCQANDMQAALQALSYGVGSSGYNWYVIGNGSPYVASSVLAVSAVVSATPTDLTNSPDMKFLFREGLLSELSRVARNANMTDAVLAVDANGLVSFNTNYATVYSLYGYAPLAGATFSGKINTAAATSALAGFNIAAGVAPSSPLSGDLWFTTGGNYLYYRSPTAQTLSVVTHQLTNTFSAPQIIDTTSSTLAGLRLTQKGTAPALVIEDGTPATPDTSAFVVNANGIVGIGKDPATWVPATGVLLDVGGKVITATTATTPGLNIGASIAAAPTSAVNGDIWITNAASPKLAYRTGGVNYYPTVANQFNTFSAGVAITSNSTSPQLTITQLGTGHALVVEDATSTDATSTVIDQNGNVGIGVSPTAGAWTATQKLEINGYATSTTAPTNDNTTKLATTEHVKNIIRGVVADISSSGWALGASASQPNTIVRVYDDPYSSAPGNMIVPTEAPEFIPVGTQYVFVQTGTTPFNIVGDGGGVQIKSFGNKHQSGGQHAVCTLIKTAVGEWYLAGNLV